MKETSVSSTTSEEPDSEKSDFILTVSFVGNFSIGKEKWFLLQALKELIINE